MKAKSNIIGIIVAMLAIGSFGDQVVAQQPPPEDGRCVEMATTSIEATKDKLRLFAGNVFGKPPELWQENDFNILLANAKACDGQPVGLTPQVSYQAWANAVHNTATRMKPITDITVPLTEQFKNVFPVKDGRILCTHLFDFRKDDHWFTNNSGDIFGVPFESMDDRMRESARSFMAACEPALVEILKNRGKIGTEVAPLLKSMNVSIDRDQNIPKVQIENLVEELTPRRNGKVVPLAYVSPNTVSVVRRVNTSMLRKVRMQTDDMVLISKWADNVFDLVREGPDRAYAEKVKEVVRRGMFPG